MAREDELRSSKNSPYAGYFLLLSCAHRKCAQESNTSNGNSLFREKFRSIGAEFFRFFASRKNTREATGIIFFKKFPLRGNYGLVWQNVRLAVDVLKTSTACSLFFHEIKMHSIFHRFSTNCGRKSICDEKPTVWFFITFSLSVFLRNARI